MTQIQLSFTDTQIYRHKITGQRMTILRMNGHIATCELIDEPKEWVKMMRKYRHPIAVCDVANLDVC